MTTQTAALTEKLLRTILSEFCKQKFPFQKSLKLVGSIHVVVDDNEALSCLLNENLSSSTTTPMTTTTAATTVVSSSVSKPVVASATATAVVAKTDEQTRLANVTNSLSAAPVVNKLNKRKRFVPRAHPNDQDEVVVKSEKRTEEEEGDEDEENNENMVIDEGSLCNDDNYGELETNEENVNDDCDYDVKPQVVFKTTKTTTAKTPTSKKRSRDIMTTQFSDTTNVQLTPGQLGTKMERATMSDGDEEEGEMKMANDSSGHMNNGGSGGINKLVMRSAGKALTNGGDQTEFQCSLCEKKFKFLCYYKRHMDARHSEEPKYVCELCNKSYKWEASYRHHIRSHYSNSNSASDVKLDIENKEN